MPVSDIVFELVLERKNYVSSTAPHTIFSEPRGASADRGRRERKRSRPQRLSAVIRSAVIIIINKTSAKDGTLFYDLIA